MPHTSASTSETHAMCCCSMKKRARLLLLFKKFSSDSCAMSFLLLDRSNGGPVVKLVCAIDDDSLARYQTLLDHNRVAKRLPDSDTLQVRNLLPFALAYRENRIVIRSRFCRHQRCHGHDRNCLGFRLLDVNAGNHSFFETAIGIGQSELNTEDPRLAIG